MLSWFKKDPKKALEKDINFVKTNGGNTGKANAGGITPRLRKPIDKKFDTTTQLSKDINAEEIQ